MTTPTYILFDTNIVFRLVNSDKYNSAPKKIFNYLISNDVFTIYNQDIINEYTRVLNQKTENQKKSKIQYFIEIIENNGYNFVPFKSTFEVRDESDRKMIDTINQFPLLPKYVLTSDKNDFAKANEYMIYESKLYDYLVKTYGELEENKELDRLDEIRTNKIIDIENKSIQLMKLNSLITIEQISNEIKEDYIEVKKVVIRSKKIEQQNDIWMVK